MSAPHCRGQSHGAPGLEYGAQSRQGSTAHFAGSCGCHLPADGAPLWATLPDPAQSLLVSAMAKRAKSLAQLQRMLVNVHAWPGMTCSHALPRQSDLE